MSREFSRRRVLGIGGAAALGSVGVAGCLAFDDDPPPIDASEAELRSIAAADHPSPADELPVRVTDAHVDAGVDRVESLLGAIPESLDEEIPNEAVRTYIDEKRSEARDRIDELADEPTNYARLSPIRRARRRAAEAEGAYAAATAGRTPEDVHEAFGAFEGEIAAAEADLTRVGDVPTHAVVVYSIVERRLDAAGRFVDRTRNPRTGASTVEVVGELADSYEWAAASLDDATHLADRAAETGDRTFDDDFAAAAAELLEDLDDRLADLPDDPYEAAPALFDAPVEGTPRERIAQVSVRSARGSYERAADYLEDGRLARSLESTLAADNTVRAIERLQAAVAEGAYDRPADEDDVRAAREEAIDAVESARAGADHPYLAAHRLDRVASGIGNGDRQIELDASHRPDRAALNAIAAYAVAAAIARSAADAIQWLETALSRGSS